MPDASANHEGILTVGQDICRIQLSDKIPTEKVNSRFGPLDQAATVQITDLNRGTVAAVLCGGSFAASSPNEG